MKINMNHTKLIKTITLISGVLISLFLVSLVALAALKIETQLDMALNKIINLGTPTSGSDAVTKDYVDNAVVAAGGAGTLYLTSSTFRGNHNCDDNPGACCQSGYHICDTSEFAMGGRRVETSGTGRDTSPGGGPEGWIDTKSGSLSGEDSDCSDWTSVSSVYYGQTAEMNTFKDSTGGATMWYHFTVSNCVDYERVWCCSD